MRFRRQATAGALGQRLARFSFRNAWWLLWAPIIFSAIQTMPLQLRMWRQADQMFDRTITANGEQFDYIIVGAGLAGSVVAYRLSKAGHSVLFLEAGGEPYPFQMVPGFLMLMINNPETDWMFRSVPQKRASLNSVKRESSWSVGKGLGGTGTLNIMIYLRGHKRDYDNWARLVNDSGWSFDGLLPHFKSIEDYFSNEGPRNRIYHGFGGELRIEEPDYLGIADEFIEAFGEFGYPKVDLNAPYKEGFDRIKYPIKDGRRIATYLSFIESARKRPNLKLVKYAHVNKVLIDENNVAYGVEYEKQGKKIQVHARKEIVLSAGTVGSSKILMLSGIGPHTHLTSLGIGVKKDLPVGENLQDHLGVYLHPFFIDEPGRTIRLDRDITPMSIMNFLQSGKGVLTSSGVQATGCIVSSVAKERGEVDWPDIHYFLFGFSSSSTITGIVSKAFNLERHEMDKYYQHGDDKDSFYIIVTGARPFSKGYVRLGSSNPQDSPIIDPKYLEDANNTDLKVLIEATKKAVNVVENSSSLGSKLNAKFTDQKLPGCEQFEFRSDEYWKCYIQRYSVTLHHPVGTAKMGLLEDSSTVVDTRLRVKGIERLRVVDSSIQPVIIVTNAGATALAIGEKGASMILEDALEDNPHLPLENIESTFISDNRLRRFSTGR